MINLSVPDMSCNHCKATVEAALAGVDPTAKVVVDLATHRVEVTTTATKAALIAALDGAGYAAQAV